jgi:hypothetical protein
MHRTSWLLLALSAAFASLVFYSLLEAEPVRVTASHLEHRDGQVYVQGEVTNKGATVRAIDLEVHYYDSRGRLLSDDTLELDHLRPGEIRRFRSPPRSSAEVNDFSILLNHGRNPYGN